MRIITGFHAIEEFLRAVEADITGKSQRTGIAASSSGSKNRPQRLSHTNNASVASAMAPEVGKKPTMADTVSDQPTRSMHSLRLLYAKQGPRVKKIIAQAEKLSIVIEPKTEAELVKLTEPLPAYLQEHRGIILIDERPQTQLPKLSADALLAKLASREKAFVVVLDSITDPHNTGAIIRSADQFGVDAVVLPERRTAGDFQTITKISAGAAAWVPLLYTANLVRTVETLKKHGFWVFGADAEGASLLQTTFPDKTVLVMGSEGSGISRLLKAACDSFTAIPTSGKLDSLNVSVAAGILMYEIRRQQAVL